MKLDKVWAFHLQVSIKKTESINKVEGGELTVTEDIRSIFEPAFLGLEKRPASRQPFHFNFGGKIRSNAMRDKILEILDQENTDIENCCATLATDLQKLIDDRIGDILFTVAAGWNSKEKRCAMWVYPSESPIRFFSKQGKPMVEELKRAFSRRSKYRKAAFFQGPINVTRNDFLRGEIVDSTRQGKSRSVAHYWVERFLHGQIELKSARGVAYLIKGLKLAQKSATTAEEKASVIAAYNHLLSGSLQTTTLSQFANMLRGTAKDSYLSSVPTTIEKDAVFTVETSEVKRKIKHIVFILSNGIEVIFPSDESLNPNQYLFDENGKKYLRLNLPVEEKYYD